MNRLKDIIICPHCCTPNLRKNIKPDQEAVCANCGKLLYTVSPNIELKIFLLVCSGIIFFVIGMFLPVVSINIAGYKENLRIFEASFFLFKQGYIIISLFVFFTIFFFPFICSILYFMSSFLLLVKFNKVFIKKLLLIITVMKNWCFLDIFFVAILVSLVKLISYAEISVNVGFIAYVIFLSIMFYIVKYVGVDSLWDLYENI